MKSGDVKEVDIKDKIRTLEAFPCDGKLILVAELDSGSASNLSPELVIRAFLDHALPYTERYDIEVCRKSLKIDIDYDITWM